MRVRIGVVVLVCALIVGASSTATAQHYSDFTIPRPVPNGSFLVIGMLGGIEHWNAGNRPVRQLAIELRNRHLPNVYTETIEHRHKALAVRLICDALDTNRDGKLDEQERASARIILYGHSMGAASVVSVAKRLNQLGIPVLLTIQVDSIGQGDGSIPSNVSRAANFYQTDAVFLHGNSTIRAQDPAKTTIIGNFRYEYKGREVDLSRVALPERIAGGAHTKMEFDPEVWKEVEKLIVAEFQKH